MSNRVTPSPEQPQEPRMEQDTALPLNPRALRTSYGTEMTLQPETNGYLNEGADQEVGLLYNKSETLIQ